MLHPNQFQVNEAWIAFRLNDESIQTERDGSFNCIALMDAASCLILGTAMVPVGESEPSQLEIRRLFKAGWVHKKKYPITLFLPAGQFQTILPAEAQRQKISVIPVDETQLDIFVDDARQSFMEYLQGGDPNFEA